MRATIRTTGVIYLCDRIGEIIDGKQYENPSMRKRIINDWKRLYAAMYSTCFLQISPVVNAHFVNKEGLNSKHQHNLNQKDSRGRFKRKISVRHTKDDNLPCTPASKIKFEMIDVIK